MKKGGQFGAEKGGQFAPESGGQFRAEKGGQFERIFQKKIEKDPNKPKNILTESGVGYRFVSDSPSET